MGLIRDDFRFIQFKNKKIKNKVFVGVVCVYITFYVLVQATFIVVADVSNLKRVVKYMQFMSFGLSMEVTNIYINKKKK